MIKKLRALLLIVLVGFVGLFVYQSLLTSPPTPVEQRKDFIRKHESAIRETRALVTKLLAEGNSGAMVLPDLLSAKGVVIAQVVYANRPPTLTLICNSLEHIKDWSLQASPGDRQTFAAANRFLIISANGETIMPIILFQDSVYDGNGNPTQLIIYFSRNPPTTIEKG